MLNLNDLKTFLNLPQSRDKDIFLQSAIRQAVSTLEGLFNRELELKERTEFTNSIYENKITSFYLSCFPVFGITEIQKYNYTDLSFSDLIPPSDISSSTYDKQNGEIMILRSLCLKNYHAGLKVKYTGGYRFQTGTGTVSITTESKIVTGTGTSFRSDCFLNDEINIAGIVRKITAINGDEELTVDQNYDSFASDLPYTLSNVPEDIQQGLTYLAALHYLSSSFARESTGLSSASVNLSTLDDNNLLSIIDGNRYLIPSRYTFTSLDLKNLIKKYRQLNI